MKSNSQVRIEGVLNNSVGIPYLVKLNGQWYGLSTENWEPNTQLVIDRFEIDETTQEIKECYFNNGKAYLS